ncbi:MAG: Gfo/Idh/MocA family oxidoreductase [Clostridia bacterium]|nr:Gfo/Idh/MocA family oxidoreductase [Clostridia bacterium]
MRKVGLGFIGCGICARDLHLPALKQIPDLFEIVNVCSRTEKKVKAFCELSGAKRWCTDVDELLADSEVEAVMINYPFEMNLALTEKALAVGKHVIVEKPMAKTMEEASRMRELEKSTDRVTMIAEGFHYRTSVIRVKELISEGAIGKPGALLVRLLDNFPRDAKWLTESNWRLSCVGGVMLDRDVHWFAAIREIMGEVESAIGYQKLLRDDIGPVDQVSLYMKFENGATGTFIDVASVNGLSENTFTIIGTEGSILMEGFKKITVTDRNGDVKVIEFPEGDGGGYVEEFRDFHDCIVNGGTPVSSFEEGYKDLELGMISLDSNDRWQDLKI